ncbi:NAD(P)H-dependent oxidoreductase [Nitratireductor rhodophyticola]|uniref:NAD(P)H-dependent oxidoreductase n=1 Tax=Nitratireductor rhodophyticola TaxID=2854036 RepID=UPI002AC9825B|nr:NAD(P)H-dependent oxidoreductase [Nitratireductor rhodophyticola]WPZ13841.1 NAD(P)H-dependent oxidoreductase [Nitratireductor rhodophyticola]
MHALIVFAHPEPASFNGTLKDAAAARLEALGHTVEVSDLYGEAFDPVEGAAHYADRQDPDHFAALAEQRHAGQRGTLPADVRREIARIERADLVIFQFPLWWHAQPAILKGWFDRVFVNGLLYSGSKRYDRGFFRGRRAVLSVTTGAPETSFAPGGRSGDIELLLWPIHYSLNYMGFSVLPPFLTFGVAGHGYRYDDDQEKALRLNASRAAWEARLETLPQEAALPFPGWNDWDEAGLPRPGAPVDGALRFRTGQALQ